MLHVTTYISFQAMLSLFYEQFYASQEPLKDRISSGELLKWFNEQLLYQGEVQWNIMGKNRVT